jgi:hypothetical protein
MPGLQKRLSVFVDCLSITGSPTMRLHSSLMRILGGMKRFAIFLVLWPLLNGLTALAVVLPFVARVPQLDEYFMRVYVVGSGPALVVALADWWFSGLKFRVLGTGVASVVVTATAISTVMGEGLRCWPSDRSCRGLRVRGCRGRA